MSPYFELHQIFERCCHKVVHYLGICNSHHVIFFQSFWCPLGNNVNYKFGHLPNVFTLYSFSSYEIILQFGSIQITDPNSAIMNTSLLGSASEIGLSTLLDWWFHFVLLFSFHSVHLCYHLPFHSTSTFHYLGEHRNAKNFGNKTLSWRMLSSQSFENEILQFRNSELPVVCWFVSTIYIAPNPNFFWPDGYYLVLRASSLSGHSAM